MPDLSRKPFGYSQLWPLRPADRRNRVGSYMLDPTFYIRIGSGPDTFFSCTRSGPDHRCWIRIGSVFVHLARFPHRCVLQDPFGLNEVGSNLLPVKQIGTRSVLSIQDRVVNVGPESDLFLSIWPGSDSDALSRMYLIIIIIMRTHHSYKEPFSNPSR